MIIALEGGDCSGKKTQSLLLKERLTCLGKVVVIECPIKSKITHPLIYWMLKKHAVTFPNLFQVLLFWNRFWFQITKLWWLRIKDDYIIFDRWALSGLVYGTVANVSSKLLNMFYWLNTQPTKTFILNGKSYWRKELDIYESNKKFQEEVNTLYRKCAELNLGILINNEMSSLLINEAIIKNLKRNNK
jgi:thymidylate kinase